MKETSKRMVTMEQRAFDIGTRNTIVPSEAYQGLDFGVVEIVEIVNNYDTIQYEKGNNKTPLMRDVMGQIEVCVDMEIGDFNMEWVAFEYVSDDVDGLYVMPFNDYITHTTTAHV